MPKLKRESGEARATDFVESLDRGLRLLQAFGDLRGPMTLSDVARAAGLPRATARRILFTLEHGGFVAGDGKLFTLTPHVLTLAGSYLRSNQVVAVLQPVLDRISSAAQVSAAMFDVLNDSVSNCDVVSATTCAVPSAATCAVPVFPPIVTRDDFARVAVPFVTTSAKASFTRRKVSGLALIFPRGTAGNSCRLPSVRSITARTRRGR